MPIRPFPNIEDRWREPSTRQALDAWLRSGLSSVGVLQRLVVGWLFQKA